MIEQTYQVLGFDRLLEIVSTFASCQPGRSLCLSLKPSQELARIESELKLVSEMRLLHKAEGFPSFSGVEDLTGSLERGQVAGAHLEGEDLLSVARTVEASAQVRKRLRAKRALFPGLWELAEKIPVLEDLCGEIHRCISPQGTVKDEASADLKKVRRKKRRLRESLQKSLETFCGSNGPGGRDGEQVVSVRDGRYVVSMRADLRSRFGGIVHGYSRSRATCFFEPMQVVQDNNRMAELEEDERAEVMRVLSGLTQEVAARSGDLLFAQFLVGRFDSLRARARFAEAYGCVNPLLGRGGGIRLLGARNPLLVAVAAGKGRGAGEGSVVPVDVRLEGGKRLLIISGPNRGGKTVTLKTIGLLALMAQAGLHVPAREGSRLPVFDRIMAEIGDDQDLETGASTFSAHAGHLKAILEHAGPHSLILIDEPGMGTDPDEGAALAMALLDELMEKGTYVAVSTHYSRLKAYGIQHARAVNASVFFDEAEKRPTFELRYGAPGVSRGLDVARNVGVPEKILARASQYLDRDEVRLNLLIERLNCKLAEATAREEEARKAKSDLERAREEAEHGALQAEAERRHLMEELRAQGQAILGEAREELRKSINALKRKGSSQSRAARGIRDVETALMALFGDPGQQENRAEKAPSLFPGGRVHHRKLGRDGIVQAVDPEKRRAEMIVGSVKVSAPFEDLAAAKEPAPPKAPRGGGVSWDVSGRSALELNVIGYRVADALPLIDRTLDRALMDGERCLRIVHGYGTGKLRGAIRAHLEGVPHVKQVSSADPRLGGEAITVVELN